MLGFHNRKKFGPCYRAVRDSLRIEDGGDDKVNVQRASVPFGRKEEDTRGFQTASVEEWVRA